MFRQDIARWKEDDKRFVESHSFPHMLVKAKNQPFVTFVGVPGSGKTATARHIALILQKEGYEILPIADKNKIEDYCDPHKPQVFVINDVIGEFGLKMEELNALNKYQDRLRKPTMSETKFIMTCREMIYRNETVLSCFLFESKNIIMLHSVENALNDHDKLQIFAKYDLEKNLLTYENLASSSNMFPYLCKLFCKEKKFKCYGPTFFISPVPCILEELDSVQLRNRCQYASLVLLMANKNKLSEDTFENKQSSIDKINFDEMKMKILKKCKVPHDTDTFRFMDALSEMVGTFTKKCGNEFTFIHSSMLEITAYSFGRRYPELILQYMSSDYICNYIKVKKDGPKKRKIETDTSVSHRQSKPYSENETVKDLCIELKESDYPILSERLFQDVETLEWCNVFGNEALKHPAVLQHFISIMRTKSYTELHPIFLSEITKAFKIHKAIFRPEKRSVKKGYYHECIIQSLLSNEKGYHNMNNYGDIRRVRPISWVIYYGHDQILQYIIDQIMKEKGTICELFQNSYNSYNKCPCCILNINQNDTNLEAGRSLYDCMATTSNNKSNLVMNSQIATFDSGKESHFSVYNKEVTYEQWRLLCLGCYSGNLTIIQILLKYIDKSVVNMQNELNLMTIACESGYLNIVKELFKAGANVNTNSYMPPLITACEHDHLSIVVELLKAGADVNACFDAPINVACENGHLGIVVELIKAGNKADCLQTPLAFACEKGHLDVVKELIKSGADVNLKTPITFACKEGHINIVEELIKEGADVNLEDGNRTPITNAYDGGHLKIVKLLMKAGADGKTEDTHEIALHIVNKLLRIEADANLKDPNQRSLISACDQGCLSVVKNIIKRGVDVNLKDDLRTPLIVACYQGHLSVVEELIKAGADVNMRNEFITPLEVACYEGHSSILLKLIKTGVNIRQIHKDDSILLPAACYFGHQAAVKELIKAGIDVNQVYEEETPLTAACYTMKLEVVEELIKAGADVNQSVRDNSPLMVAYDRENSSLIEMLKEAGAV